MMYIDSPFAGYKFRQAMTRVDRVYQVKPSSLIVKLIRIANPLAKYAVGSRGSDKPVKELEDERIRAMWSEFEQLCICCREYDDSTVDAKLGNGLQVHQGSIDK